MISLPMAEDELTRLVDEPLSRIGQRPYGSGHCGRQSVSILKSRLLSAPMLMTKSLRGLPRIREGATADAASSPKVSEFDVFASGRPEIGQNSPTAKLYAQTLPREAWADAGAGVDLTAIKNVVAVHRLREVSCLYGFTRFEAAPTSADGELEDIQLAVHGAPISRDADWLPAIEQFGEGTVHPL